jgi:hypothetical protein
MGGYLSSHLAIIQCIYDEHRFMKSIGPRANQLFGIRQVDDLLLLTLIDDTNAEEKHFAEKTLQRFRTQDFPKAKPVYSGGLILEQQEVTFDNKYYDLIFAGSQLKLGSSLESGFHARPHFKNSNSILNHGTIKTPRLPPWESYIDPRIYAITVKGMLHLFRSPATDDNLLENAIHMFLMECELYRYPRRVIIGTVKQMRDKSPRTWSGIYDRLKKKAICNKIQAMIRHTNFDFPLATHRRQLW